MKKLFYMISVAAFMASFSSCGKFEQENTPADNLNADGTTTLKISATVPQTKTYMNNGEVKWVKGDFIQIFAEDGSYKFTDAVTYEDSAPATYDFTVTDWPADKTPSCAIYAGQYAQETSPATYVDGVFTATLPSSQKINNKKSFAKTANLSVGELVNLDTSYAIEMKNVGGLFKYTISSTGKVSKVKIEDVNGAAMAGTVNITMENGIPKTEVVEGKSSVTMEANVSGGNGLFPNDYYFACVLPGTYTLKVTVTFTDGTTNVLEANSPITVKRNEWVDLGVIDKVPSSEEPEQPGVSEELTITLDFSASWPFTVDAPKSENAEGKMVYSKSKTKDTYTLTQNGVDYQFEVYEPATGYYYTGSAFRFENGTGSNGGYIKLPAISGKKLVNATVTITNTSNKAVSFSSDGTDKGDVAELVTIQKVSSHTFECTNTAENTSYYLYSKGSKLQIGKLVLTYSK